MVPSAIAYHSAIAKPSILMKPKFFLWKGPTSLKEVRKTVEILMDKKEQNIRGCRVSIFVSTIETVSVFLKEN